MAKNRKMGKVAPQSSIDLSRLNYNQRQKFDYLLSSFNNNQNAVYKLVNLLEYRGRNSWSMVNEKLDMLHNSSRENQYYYDALYERFQIDQQYSTNEIVQIVGETRRSLGLRPYVGRIRTMCQEDFFNLFIVKNTSQQANLRGTSTSVEGFTAVFKLKHEVR